MLLLVVQWFWDGAWAVTQWPTVLFLKPEHCKHIHHKRPSSHILIAVADACKLNTVSRKSDISRYWNISVTVLSCFYFHFAFISSELWSFRSYRYTSCICNQLSEMFRTLLVVLYTVQVFYCFTFTLFCAAECCSMKRGGPTLETEENTKERVRFWWALFFLILLKYTRCSLDNNLQYWNTADISPTKD